MIAARPAARLGGGGHGGCRCRSGTTCSRPSSSWSCRCSSPASLQPPSSAGKARRSGATGRACLPHVRLYFLILGLELLVVSICTSHAICISISLGRRDRPPEAGAEPGATPPQRRIAFPQFRWDELAVILGPLSGRGGRVHRRDAFSPRAEDPARDRRSARCAALDESLDDLRTDPDLRPRDHRPTPGWKPPSPQPGSRDIPLRRRSSTSSGRSSLDASAEAVRRLTELFEWARFSHHEPEPSMRDDAVDALIAVRDELRASELVPA